MINILICRKPVKQNYRIIDNVELTEFWNIFRDNININNDENDNVGIAFHL